MAVIDSNSTLNDFNTKIVFNYYSQDGTQGNQIYDNSNDEDVDVIEPMLFINYQIDENTNINANFTFDTWTAASDTKLDANTGASKKVIGRQSRTSGSLGLTKDYKSYKYSSRLGISSEYDYRSLNFGGLLETHHAEDNFVFAIAPQIFLDQAAAFDVRNQKTGPFQGRTIGSIDLSATQLLTANDIIQFGYTYIYMNGMLNNISNSVKVLNNPYSNNFSRVEERLPSNRTRHAVYTKLIHAFNDEVAGHFNYRYYQDDWDIKANTFESGLRYSFNEDDDFLLFTYRYHDQTQTKYFVTNTPTALVLMTSDSDMAEFNAHRLGLHYTHNLGDFDFSAISTENWNASVAFYHYNRSNDLSYNIAQISLGCDF